MAGDPSRALELSTANVNDLFRYEPASGKLFWKHRDAKYFTDGKRSAQAEAKIWNGKNARAEISYRDSNGYITLSLFGKRNIKAHRVIWLMVTGAWPTAEIDHINGVRDDNRIVNLRAVTTAENAQNRALRSDNRSGVHGVAWHKNHRKWQVSIKANGRNKHLGLFDDLDAAVAARKAAEVELGFHANHGRV